jgi:SpoIID/LytB domain protein
MKRPRSTALIIAAALLVPLAVAAPAAAAPVPGERVTLPPGGAITVAGRGFGHGIGLSQYGARARADAGSSAASILGFYYPGTASASPTNSALRVLVSADNDDTTVVVAEAGMTVTDSSGTRTVTFPSAPTQLRLVRLAERLVLQGLVGSTWTAWSGAITGSAATVNATDATVQVVLPGGARKDYRGAIRAVFDGASPGLATVDVVPMESYLRSVVPAEVPATWPAAAVQAQAVAARTYASYERRAHASNAWDICDTTACQVYPGYRSITASGAVTVNEHSASDAAISATARVIRTYGGNPAFTQFSSSNGGWTTAGSQPYLRATADRWDAVGNPNATWSVRVTGAQLRSAFPTVGTPRSITVDRRNGNGEWGGRVVDVTVAGSAGSSTVSGATFRSRFGLRSDWWRLTGAAALDSDSSLDGRPDFLAVMSNGTLRRYLGNGTGGFTSTRTFGGGWNAMRIVVNANDLTGDGRPEVLAVDQAGILWRYSVNAAGDYPGRVQVGSGWAGFQRIVAPGDADGDGDADLLATDAAGVMWLYRGNGAGAFGRAERLGSGWGVMTAVLGAGDLTGDGRADFLARRNDGRLFLYAGNSAGGYNSSQVGTGWSGMRLVAVSRDWNGDRLPDVLAADGSGLLWLYPWLGTRFGSRTQIGNGWGIVRLIL